MNYDPSRQNGEPTAFLRSRYALGLLVIGAIAGYFLLSEHRAHFIGALPFLLLLGCPLMHVFMHHGHRTSHGGNPLRHGGGEQAAEPAAAPQASTDRNQP